MKDFRKNLIEIYPKLKKHATSVAKSFKLDSADDLLHQTIERALKKEHPLDALNLEAWLKRIMKNIAIDLHRKGLKVESTGEERKHLEATGKKTSSRKVREVSYENESTDDETDNDKSISDSEFNPASFSSQGMSSSLDPKNEQDTLEIDQSIIKLYDSIRKMGHKCQDIFYQYMEEEGSFLELSKRMDSPLGTVQSRFHRCKEQLLMIMLKELPGDNYEI